MTEDKIKAEDIKKIFKEYIADITDVEILDNRIKLLFNPKSEFNLAFGSVTIDFMWKYGYRVHFWNFMDNIAEIMFIKEQQILKNQEDSQKYHDLMNANNDVVKNNINITEEHQVVERLKAELNECIKEREEARKLFIPDLSFINEKIDYLQSILEGTK